MAFEDMGDLSRLEKDVSPRGHGQFMTGTLMAVLMGHGYRDAGVSHMKPIMEAWERFNGMGRRSRSVSKAMEEVAYAKAAELLRTKEIGASDENYGNARLYEAYRGLYLQDKDVAEGEYGFAANIDGALVDVSGEYTDPRSGKAISGRVYAERQALEVVMRQRIEENNAILEADGEPTQAIPEPKYTEKLPWMGTADIKVTMSNRVLEENALKGIPAGWAVQTHHYNKMLREDNERNGFGTKDYPNLMGVYQFCTADMEGKFHEIEYDPDLEVEMGRRAEAFAYCVKNGIPPNSSEMESVFYEYPVKRPEPEAIFLSERVEKTFSSLVNQRDEIDAKIKELEGYKSNIDKDLQVGIEKLNRRMGGTRQKAFFIDLGPNKEPVLLDYKANITNRTRSDEVAINKVVRAAEGAQNIWEKSQAIWQDATLDSDERLVKLEALHKELGEAVQGVPKVKGGLDLSAFQYKEKVKSSNPKVTLKRNKNIKAIYEREMASREAIASPAETIEKHEPANEKQTSEPVTAASLDEVAGQSKPVETSKQGEVVEEMTEVSADEPPVSYSSEAYPNLQEPALSASEVDLPKIEEGSEISESAARQHADNIGLPMNFPSL
jgi:hypothetical protein